MKSFFSIYIKDIQVGGESLRLSRLFLPIFVEQFLKNFMGTINVFMLGRYSDNAVASVGVATQIINVMVMFFSVVAVGATVVISQHLGAGNRQRAADAVGFAIFIASVMGLVMGVSSSVSASWIMSAMRLEPQLIPEAVAYFRLAALSSSLQSPLAVLSGISNSYGHPKNSMLAAIFMNALNLAGNYIVIFRPFETPFYGAFGVAVARGISEFSALLLMVLLVWRMNLCIRFPDFTKTGRRIAGDILKIGIPSGIEAFSYNFSQVVTTGIVATLGAVAVTTKIYVQNIIIFVFIVGLALGQSTALMIGRLVGAGRFDEADQFNRQSLKTAICTNAGLALIMVLFRYQLMGIFTHDREIIRLGGGIMCIDFFAEVFRGVNHIEQNSLNAAGDVRFKMIVSVCSSWLISIFVSWLLGIKVNLGLYGCWIAFIMDEAVRGGISVLRWRSGKWAVKAVAARP